MKRSNATPFAGLRGVDHADERMLPVVDPAAMELGQRLAAPVRDDDEPRIELARDVVGARRDGDAVVVRGDRLDAGGEVDAMPAADNAASSAACSSP